MKRPTLMELMLTLACVGSGCTIAHVAPGCLMERTYTITCEHKKVKDEYKKEKDDGATAIIIPLP